MWRSQLFSGSARRHFLTRVNFEAAHQPLRMQILVCIQLHSVENETSAWLLRDDLYVKCEKKYILIISRSKNNFHNEFCVYIRFWDLHVLKIKNCFYNRLRKHCNKTKFHYWSLFCHLWFGGQRDLRGALWRRESAKNAWLPSGSCCTKKEAKWQTPNSVHQIFIACVSKVNCVVFFCIVMPKAVT